MKLDRVLFVNENQVGDVLLSTTLIKAFHEQYPQSKVAFYVSSDVAPLLKGLSFIDEVVVYDKGDPILPIVRKIWRYNAAFCLDFKYRSAVMPFFARIPVRAGVAHKRKLFLTHPVPTDPHEPDFYEPQNFANIIERAVGLKIIGDFSRLYISPPTETVKKAVDGLLQPIHSQKIKVVIAPFTSCSAKNWMPERFAEFCKRVGDKYNVQFLIIGVGKQNPEVFSSDSMMDLRDKTSLEEAAEIIRRADYFIGSCSAPLHMSSATGTPSLALYGGTSAKQWAPRQKVEIVQHYFECSPCNINGETCGNTCGCMKAITVDEVFAAFERLMKRYPSKNS
jgi:ADP-heptose:LPS heptosyltransferase